MASSRTIWSMFKGRPKKTPGRKEPIGEVKTPLKSALRTTTADTEDFEYQKQTPRQPLRFVGVDQPSTSGDKTTQGCMRLISPKGVDLGTVRKIGHLISPTSVGHVNVSTGVRDTTAEKVVLKELSLKADLEAKATGNEEDLWIEANDNEFILAFLGRCTDPVTNTVYLVSPFMKNGDLANCLKTGFACTSHDIAKYINQIVNGLIFLHENKEIVHGDLKPENILITDDLNVVITDFGLSRHAIRAEGEPVTESHIRTLATSRYLALEFHLHKIISCWGAEPYDRVLIQTQDDNDELLSKSMEGDIWALGNLILQMYTRKQPWHSYKQETIAHHLRRGRRPAFPLGRGDAQDRGLDFHLWFIVQKCWSHFPSHRPCASDISSWRHAGPPSLVTAADTTYVAESSVVHNRVEDLSDEVLTVWPQGSQFAEAPYIDRSAFVPVDGYVQTPGFWVCEEVQPREALRVLLTRARDDSSVDGAGWAQELLREVVTWSSIAHENLVPLLGRCKLDGIWHAVSPYWTSLRRFKDMEESAEQRLCSFKTQRNVPFLRILRDIALALQFLHSQHPPIVHGAVHLDNIVIGDRQRLHEKASDNIDACLGNYRFMHSLPIGADETHTNVKRDVYDFGVMMKELLHNRFALTDDERIDHPDWLPPLRNSSLLVDLYDLCTTEVEASRATMEFVSASLVDAVNAEVVGDLQ
ncbi:kinase-like protein [Exidia glandulosa HHB12029]|uniref:Kinase-like protein n=1 Tax=Exidia glandulosa HHB12029 TaxID=1314781 RepID=A0A165IFR6_EXIGL|nr:kinase-like protein [Exidia glandulosa HHB12029]